MRSILALCLFAACSSPSKVDAPKATVVANDRIELADAGIAKPPAPVAPPTPRNLVCEAFKGVNDKAVCTPYITNDVAQTAMINLGGQMIHCAYTLKGVECHDPIIIVQQQPAPVQDAKKATKK